MHLNFKSAKYKIDIQLKLKQKNLIPITLIPLPVLFFKNSHTKKILLVQELLTG